MDTVCSRIVVYGGGDIVFGAKSSNKRTQWTQYAVRSRIVAYGGGDIVFGTKRSNQWIQSHSGHSGCNGHSRIVVYGGWDSLWNSGHSIW